MANPIDYTEIKKVDIDTYNALQNELKRQENTLELIPSENLASRAVMEAQGSILTNKYSEGYPTKRYYGGNQHVDVIEQLAIDRAKQLFRAEHANVQPLSGAIMNVATFFALLNPGDTILGMDLGHGGHLTHGHPVTHMYKVFNFVRYKTDLENEGRIDYENLREMALKHKPKLILAGFSAYSKTLDWKKFKEIADEVGAYTMADVSHISGLIAADVLENPMDCGFDIMTTTTHKSLRGPRGGLILCKEEHKKAIDKAIFPGLQGGPLEHVIAAKAVAFKEALQPEFKQYSQNVVNNAKAMERGLKEEGITICFNETENHLLLLDLRPQQVSGRQVEHTLDELGICCNKNSIPDDETTSPMNPNGLRIGTPFITSRGLNAKECEELGRHIGKVIKHIEDEQVGEDVKAFVKKMCEKYPIYQ
ncbi:MAG: serine hydroxymethyltransferase [Candidatus Nanoarchaeia archaeon]